MKRIPVIDSHTEGEPTRVVTAPGLDFTGTAAIDRARELRDRFDGFRRTVVLEPRGWDAMVGALLLEPLSSKAVAQVIFFNNVAPLGMCVHGTIGVAVTLAHLGRIAAGRHVLETPAGDVAFTLGEGGEVAVENVESYRTATGVTVDTSSGKVTGDVAYGGNWFYLVHDHGQELAPHRVRELTSFAADVRRGLETAGITGENGAEIDHVELLGPPTRPDAQAKNFVLCPGLEYDRSPCGTGTSATMAARFAAGLLQPGETWGQESILGTLFRGTVRPGSRGVIPTVSGRAWITAESELLVDSSDPFATGIGS